MEQKTVEPRGTSFISYVTYTPEMGLYVRIGNGEISGFHHEEWGGTYYVTGYRPTANPFNYSAPPAHPPTNIGAFEVRPWGFPIPWKYLVSATKMDEELLRGIVRQVLKPHVSRLVLGRAGDVDSAVVDERERVELHEV